jgi:hypothetical protein
MSGAPIVADDGMVVERRADRGECIRDSHDCEPLDKATNGDFSHQSSAVLDMLGASTTSARRGGVASHIATNSN